MTIILDEQFPDPEDINSMDCVSADRFLNSVQEEININQVCQDQYTPSLVILSLTVIGAFLYTPICYILEVDGDTSYQNNGVTAPLVSSHFRTNEIPINTNCNTFHPELVFDFGKVVPNFTSAGTIKFRLQLIGTAPQSYNTSFISSNPYAEYIWPKGVLPSPINLRYNGERLEVLFQYFGNGECSCNIQCLTHTGVNNNIKFCKDEIQTISFTESLTGDPFSFTISLRDGLGNLSNIDIHSVLNVTPQPPVIASLGDPSRNEITIFPYSLAGIELKEVDYQIFKYVGDNNNIHVWKDWSERSYGSFIDRDILPNTSYGYAVRYRGKFGDISNISSWAEV